METAKQCPFSAKKLRSRSHSPAVATSPSQSMSGPVAATRAVLSKPMDGSDAGTIPDDGWTAKVRNVGSGSRKVRAWASCLG